LVQVVKKLIGIILILTIVLALFTGCTKRNQSQFKSSEGHDKIVIGHVSKFSNLLLYLADHLGYFEEEGIDAELRAFENNEKGMAAVLSGEIETGNFKTMPALLAIDADEDLTIVSGGHQHGYGILTLESNPKEYNFLKNYRGKTIGTVANAMEDVLTKAAITRLGFEVNKDINVVEFNSSANLVEAIKNKEVDAGTICLSDIDKSQYEGLRLAVESIEFLEKHPAYSQVARASFMEDQDNQKLFVRFNKAFLKAYKFYLENPEETVDIILNYIDIDRDMLMGCIYDENKMFRLEQFWPHPSPVKAYNWKFLQDLQAFDYLKSDKDIIHDYVYEDSYVEAMNSLAKKTKDPVYVELKSVHVC
jgi:NitT/TauT family transport system substrate-binding protein